MKGNIAIENLFSHYSGIILVVLAFVFYGNSVGHRFALDDEYVINNKTVKQGISAIPEIFSSYYSGNEKEQYGYRPLTRSIYAVEYSIFGMSTKAFHFVNVLLYGILCWLLFILLRRLKHVIPYTVSILAVLLFLLHPVHTEVTNSLKNLEEIVCIILCLLSLICFHNSIKGKGILQVTAGGILLFLAFLSKETAFVFVLIIPLYMFVSGAARFRTLISFIVSAVVVFIAYKLPSFILPASQAHFELWQNPVFAHPGPLHRLALSMMTLDHYVFQLILPYRLLFYYGYNTIPVPEWYDPYVIASFVVHLAIIVFAIVNFRKNKVLSFGILFFYAGISLFSNIPILISGIVADRLSFIASAGFCIVLSWLIMKIITNRRYKIAGYFLIAIVLLFYSYKTVSRNSDWKTAEDLYVADIPYLENSVKANDLYASFLLTKANSLLSAGRKPAELIDIASLALKHFKLATSVMPEFYNGWNNMGAIYLTFYNDTANALYAYKSAIKADSTEIIARHNVAYIYYKSRKYDLAKSEFSLALKIDSNYIPSLFNYGEIMTLEEKYDSAGYYFSRIHRLDSTHTGALLNLGSLEILKGDTARAIKYFEPVVQKDRTNKALMMNISAYYLRNGDTTRSNYYRKMAGQ